MKVICVIAAVIVMSITSISIYNRINATVEMVYAQAEAIAQIK